MHFQSGKQHLIKLSISLVSKFFIHAQIHLVFFRFVLILTFLRFQRNELKIWHLPLYTDLTSSSNCFLNIHPSKLNNMFRSIVI